MAALKLSLIHIYVVIAKEEEDDPRDNEYHDVQRDGEHLIWFCYIAVSYTHLDVYKRQVITITLEVLTTMILHITSSSKPLLQISTLLLSSISTVSYTHLLAKLARAPKNCISLPVCVADTQQQML